MLGLGDATLRFWSVSLAAKEESGLGSDKLVLWSVSLSVRELYKASRLEGDAAY